MRDAIPIASATRATLAGEGFQNTSQLACRFGNMAPVPAIYWSPTEISCPAPTGLSEQLSTVVEVTVNGLDYSMDGIRFVHGQQPNVSSISPYSGSYDGGTTVTIAGGHFVDSHDLGCRFGTSLVPARWLSQNRLECESPPSTSEEEVFLEVTTNGRDFTSDHQIFSFYRAVILHVVPSVGHTDGGTLVSIFGEGFAFAADLSVRFGLSKVQAIFVNSTHLQCFTPPVEEAGIVNILVAINGIDVQGSSRCTFTYMRAPPIVSFGPSWGINTKDTVVVLQGEGFVNTRELACSLGDDARSLPATFLSATNVSCIVPSEISIGSHPVQLTMDGHLFTASAMPFVSLEPPKMLAITPVSGPHSGGTTVRVKGVNLERSARLGCMFGSTVVVGRWESSTTMWCTTPAGDPGDRVKFAITRSGSEYSAEPLFFEFWNHSPLEFIAREHIPFNEFSAIIYAENGVNAIGTWVDSHPGSSENGRQAVGQSSPPLCDGGIFGPKPPLSPANSSRDLRWRLGASDASTKERSRGQSISIGRAPVNKTACVLRVAPDHGSHEGGTNTIIYGTNFDDAEDVRCMFGKSRVPGRWLSPSSVACVSSPGEIWTAVSVSVITNGEPSLSASVMFGYEAHPSVLGLQPSSGWVHGGAPISILGNGFTFSKCLVTHFGNISVPAIFVSPTELRSISPASLTGTVNVSVGDHDGPFTTGNGMAFAYHNVSFIGSTLTSNDCVLRGSQVNTPGHELCNSKRLACVFSEVCSALNTCKSSNEISCDIAAAELHDRVRVNVNRIDFTSADAFVHESAPTILSIMPDSGGVNGGTLVMVKGVNFVNTEEFTCQFGDNTVLGRWISLTAIQCVAPVHDRHDTVPMMITSGSGQAMLGPMDFRYYGHPTVLNISPSRGSVKGGTKVSVFGTDFLFMGDIRVRFGSTDVPATLVSPSELWCFVPRSSPGFSKILVSLNGVDFDGHQEVWYEYVDHPTTTTQYSQEGPLESVTDAVATHSRGGDKSVLSLPVEGVIKSAPRQWNSKDGLAISRAACRTIKRPSASDRIMGSTQSRDTANTVEAYVISLSPARGPTCGGTSVRVRGFNFVDEHGLRCIFGTVNVPARWLSSTQVVCATPQASHAQDVILYLQVGDERIHGEGVFSYHSEPTISTLIPSSGSVDGGTKVQIVGHDFSFTGDLHVMFGTIRVPAVFFNSSLLHCVTLPSPARTVEIGLTLNGRDYNITRGMKFNFRLNPQVFYLEPSSGILGSAISILGSGFERETTLACRFGTYNSHVVPAYFLSPHEVSCIAPAMGEMGSHSVEVTINGMDFSRDGNRFTYHAEFFLTTVKPLYSNVLNGSYVSVQGGYLKDSESLRCHFGDSLDIPGRWISQELITCPLPQTVITSFLIEIVPFMVSYNGFGRTKEIDLHLEPLAKITTLDLGVGSTAGGTTVVFNGHGFIFNGDIHAHFGTISAPVTFSNSQELTCVTPPGKPGLVDVTIEVERRQFTNGSVPFEYLENTKRSTLRSTSPIEESTQNTASDLMCNIEKPMAPTCNSDDTPSVVRAGLRSLEVAAGVDHVSPVNVQLQNVAVYGLVMHSTRILEDDELGETNTCKAFLADTGIECIAKPTGVHVNRLPDKGTRRRSFLFTEGSHREYLGVVNQEYVSSGYAYSITSRLSISSMHSSVEDTTCGEVVRIDEPALDDASVFCSAGTDGVSGAILMQQGGASKCGSLTFHAEQVAYMSLPERTISPVVDEAFCLAFSRKASATSMQSTGISSLVPSFVTMMAERGNLNSQSSFRCDDIAHKNCHPMRLYAIAKGYGMSCVSYGIETNFAAWASGSTKFLRDSALQNRHNSLPTVLFFYPLEIETSNCASTVVKVMGSNFLGSSNLSCRIDRTVKRAVWISASVVECVLDEIDPGVYELALSNDMVEFVPAMRHLLISAGMSMSNKTAHAVPHSASARGGANVELFGSGTGLLAAPSRCILGDKGVNASTLSEYCISREMTAHDQGTIPVGICDRYNSCLREQGKISSVHIPKLVAISPDCGPVSGDQPVVAELAETCNDDSSKVWCQVGDSTKLASKVFGRYAICILPEDKEGIVGVAISCNGYDFSAPLPFSYRPKPIVFNISPRYVSSGGSIVHIHGGSFQRFASGENVNTSLLCSLDGKSTLALCVSETLVLCRIPPRSPGVTTLDIVIWPQEHRLFSANVTYVNQDGDTRNVLLRPSAGPTAGGTVVSIVSWQPGTLDTMWCMFGENGQRPFQSSPREVTCISPAVQAPGRVNVSLVSMGREDFAGEFNYMDYLQLEEVKPTVVDTRGNSVITVFFRQESSRARSPMDLKCKIGELIIPATIQLEASKAMCAAPPRVRGYATVSLLEHDKLLSLGELRVFYSPHPVVSQVTPSRGLSIGGVVVDVRGHDFVNSTGLSCFFGNISAKHVEWLSTTRVKCTSPVMSPGTTHISISHDGTTFSLTSNSSSYEVYQPFTIPSVHPFERSIDEHGVALVQRNELSSLEALKYLFSILHTMPSPLNATGSRCSGTSQGSDDASIETCLPISLSDGRRSSKQTHAQISKVVQSGRGLSTAKVTPDSLCLDYGSSEKMSKQLVCRSDDEWNILPEFSSPHSTWCTTRDRTGRDTRSASQSAIRANVHDVGKESMSAFEVDISPIVHSVRPSLGSEFGGTEILIMGANFGNPEMLACFMCTLHTDRCIAISALWLSPGELSCVTPKHRPEVMRIKVINHITRKMSNDALFAFLPAPHVRGVSPTKGSFQGAIQVSLDAVNLPFTGIVTCPFGENPSMGHLYCRQSTCLVPPVTEKPGFSLEISTDYFNFMAGEVFHLDAEPLGANNACITPSKKGNRITDTPLTPSVEWSQAESATSPHFMKSTHTMRDVGRFLHAGPVTHTRSMEPIVGRGSRDRSLKVHEAGSADCAFTYCFVDNFTREGKPSLWSTLRCTTQPSVKHSSLVGMAETPYTCYRLLRITCTGIAAGNRRQSLRCFWEGDRTLDSCSHGRNKRIFELPKHDLLGAGLGQSLNFVAKPNGGEKLDVPILSSGPLYGGSIVDVPYFGAPSEGMLCMLINHAGASSVTIALPRRKIGSVSCLTPSWSSAGSVMLYVGHRSDGSAVLGWPFHYYAQSVLLDVEPSSGYDQGGTILRLAAVGITYFTDLRCGFFDMSNILIFSSTAMRIPEGVQCPSPPLPPGSFHVELSLNGVDFSRGSEITYTVRPSPAVLRIRPSSGPFHGGTEVTVFGASFGLEDTIVCRFGRSGAPATVVNAEHVVCESPPMTRGFHDTVIVELVLEFGGNVLEASNNVKHMFSYTTVPALSYSSPRAGSGMESTPGCLVGRISPAFTDKFDTKFDRTVFRNSELGDISSWGVANIVTYVDHTSENKDANSCLAQDEYGAKQGNERTFSDPNLHDNQAANMVTIRPDNGPPIGGTPVVVTGATIETSDLVTCHFGERRMRGLNVNATHYVCLSPPASGERMVDFFLTFGDHGVPSGKSSYRYTDVPSILYVRPERVHVAPTTTNIMIQGEGFRNTSALACILDDESRISATYVSSKFIMCAVARSSSGYIRLEATNNGIQGSSSGHHVAFIPRPIVTAISPHTYSSGAMGVAVSGLYFVDTPNLACFFGTQSTLATWVSTEEVCCAIPRALALVTLNMSMINQIITLDLSAQSITIDSVEPSFGDTDGGTLVTVHVTNLKSSAHVVCRFGKAGDVIAEVVNASTLQCIAPAGPAGPARLQVASDTRVFSTSVAMFVYTARANVKALHPSLGHIDGGTGVKLQGSGFSNTSNFECWFGESLALSIIFVSTEEVLCRSPPHATPAVVPVSVKINGSRSMVAVNFRYILRTVVLDVSPREVVHNKLSWLTITGAYFFNDPLLTCFFNASIPTPARWLSTSLLRCLVPSNLPCGANPVMVQVANNGRDLSASAATIYVRPPSIIHLVRPNGTVVGRSTPVSVLLKSYSQRLQHEGEGEHVMCLFDDNPTQAVVTLTLNKDCAIQTAEPTPSCTVVRCTAPPAEEASRVSLRVITGGGVSLSDPATFTYEDMTQANSLSPSFGPLRGGTRVSVTLTPEIGRGISGDASCLFSDMHSEIYVEGEVTEGNDKLPTLVCYTPLWRSSSRQPIFVSVRVFIGGVRKDNGNLVFTYSRQANIPSFSPVPLMYNNSTNLRDNNGSYNWKTLMGCACPIRSYSFSDSSSTHWLTHAKRVSQEGIFCQSYPYPPESSHGVVPRFDTSSEGLGGCSSNFLFDMMSVNSARGPTIRDDTLSWSLHHSFDVHDASIFGFYHMLDLHVSTASWLFTSPPLPSGSNPPIKIAQGADTEQAARSFEHFVDMDVVALNPKHGWTTGGTNITLSISSLEMYDEKKASLFCAMGGNLRAPVKIDTSTGSVVCSCPALAETGLRRGEKDVMVYLVCIIASGAVLRTSAEVFHYEIPPTVTAVIPDHGQQGTRLRVLGDNFENKFGLECLFGAQKTPAIFLTSQMVDCHVPRSETGIVYVTVLSGGVPSVWSTGVYFTIQAQVLPSTVQGYDAPGGERTVFPASRSRSRSCSASCRLGKQKIPGTSPDSSECMDSRYGLDIPFTTAALNDGGFWDIYLPISPDVGAAIIELSPTEGSVHGGTRLKIAIDGCTYAPELKCIFTSIEGSSYSKAVAEGDVIMCTTPPAPGLSTGVVRVSVTQGRNVLAGGANFRFIPAFFVNALRPLTTEEGDRLLILGTGFTETSKLACRFSDTSAGSSVVVEAYFISSTKLWCIAPTVATMQHAHLEITANGIDYTAAGPGFFVHSPAAVTSISPSVWHITGGIAVTITGMSSGNKRRCRYRNRSVPACVLQHSRLICVNPEAPNGRSGLVPLDLTVDGREVAVQSTFFAYLSSTSDTQPATMYSEFMFENDSNVWKATICDRVADNRKSPEISHALPVVLRLEPKTCSGSGAVDVLVRGKNFVSSSTPTCSFGGINIRGTYRSSTSIMCRVPRHAPGEVVLEVSSDGGTFSSSGVIFTFHETPSVISVEPSHGPQEGLTNVTIKGRHFRNLTTTVCRFGDVAVPAIYISSSQLRCCTPPMEQTGSVVRVQVCVI